ncbi:MAG: phospholipid carrier-dependent glycosyltransferase [Candidatus Shapirobacteria bacterium]
MLGIKSKNVFWGLITICVLHLVANIIWLAWDKAPPAWDQAAHIRSVVLANQWMSGEFWGGFGDLVKAFGGYPPLVYLLGGVWSLLFGVGVAQITFVNSIVLVFVLVGLFKLILEIYKDEKLALGVTVLFSFMPVVYDISRNMLLDLALSGWVVWGLWSLVKSKYLIEFKWGLVWLLCLMGASLTKINGFIYFFPMVVWVIYAWFKKDEIKIFRNLAVYGVLYLGLVGWWWLVNKENIINYLTGLAGTGEKLTDPMNLGDWQTWIHYFRLMLLHQVSPIPTLIWLGVLGVCKKGKFRKISFLIFFGLVNYVIFTIIKNKDFRFTLPMLPIVAITLVMGLKEMGRVKIWISWILVIWMGWMYINNSFGFPIRKPWVVATPTFVAGDVEWIGIDDYPVRSPKSEEWPQKFIINDLEKMAVDKGHKISVLVLINREEINDNNLGMYKEIMGTDAFEPGSVGSRERFQSENEIEGLVGEYDAVLVPDSTYEPAPFYGINLEAYRQARDWALTHPERLELVANYYVYGTENLYLMKVR